MANFSDLLKKWFYTNSSSAASSDARIPLLTATGEPKGSDTMENIASVLGLMTNDFYFKTINQMGAQAVINIPFTEFTTGIVLARTSGSWNLKMGIVTGDKIQEITSSPTGDASVVFNADSGASLCVYRNNTRGNLVINHPQDFAENVFILIIGTSGI